MPTQKDVANAAGVTPTTVSLILNGKAKERHIHPETVARVMEAMKELGYQPNTTARRLRSSGAERPILPFTGLRTPGSGFAAILYMKYSRYLQPCPLTVSW